MAIFGRTSARPVTTAGKTNVRPGLQNLSPIEQFRAGKLSLRLLLLFVGLSIFGVSVALVIRSDLGMFPWDVLHYGLARHLPLSIGAIMILASFFVLLIWIPLRQMPGLGTIANAIWIGVVVDVALRFLPEASALPWQIGMMTVGIVLNGVATAMYIGAQFGPGPRDGLMTGLSRVTGRSIRLARTGIEIAVVTVGWLLGGVVGIGTLLFALSIGPLTQFFLPWFTVPLEVPTARKAAPAAGGEPGN